ncbi:MAG: di-heme oxidoredictase family protein [Polyangiaceae bacterium]
MIRRSVAIVSVFAFGCNTESNEVAYLKLSGGDTTTVVRSPGSFEAAAPNLTEAEKLKHFAGDADFEAIFSPPPSTVHVGLGAQFNHDSCASCHIRNGRGFPRVDATAAGSTLLVRVSVSGRDPLTGGAVPYDTYGDQLQDHAIPGERPEASITLTWEEKKGAYGDGTEYVLRKPKFDILLADGTPLPSNVMTSPRIAPPVFGLGLLEAVSDETLEALEDPKDDDGDGISGRVNRAWDIEKRARKIGRFGWKANTTDFLHQSAGAYAADMGVTNRLHPAEDGTADLSDDVLESTAFYTETLAVPIRASLTPTAEEGGRAFADFGCAGCHRPTLHTGQHAIAALSNQTIAPYTDLLVHDLGDDLADGRPDYDASGREWRTTPLWGIGLAEAALGEGAYLHDGRARSIEEAILWHGGEAETARVHFVEASRATRKALLEFLSAL